MKTFLSLYVIWIIVTFSVTMKDFDNATVTPRQIYEYSYMNIFGCVILFIVLLILDPLFFLARFIYWIFHIGKKRN